MRISARRTSLQTPRIPISLDQSLLTNGMVFDVISITFYQRKDRERNGGSPGRLVLSC